MRVPWPTANWTVWSAGCSIAVKIDLFEFREREQKGTNESKAQSGDQASGGAPEIRRRCRRRRCYRRDRFPEPRLARLSGAQGQRGNARQIRKNSSASGGTRTAARIFGAFLQPRRESQSA